MGSTITEGRCIHAGNCLDVDCLACLQRRFYAANRAVASVEARVGALESALAETLFRCHDRGCTRFATWSGYTPCVDHTFCDEHARIRKAELRTSGRREGEPVYDGWRRLKENAERAALLEPTAVPRRGGAP